VQLLYVGADLSALALLNESCGPSDDDVREFMSGNICRCGAYRNIVAAIKRVRRANSLILHRRDTLLERNVHPTIRRHCAATTANLAWRARDGNDWRDAACRSILPVMESPDLDPPIRVGAAPDGSVTYLVDLPPEALPPVTRRDLERAWYAARRAALAEEWGTVRIFRFLRPDGEHSDLVLADRDASCWAGALDAIYGMGTRQGLSLCLRLLALIDLLAQSPWAVPLLRLARDGAEPDPALLYAAATEPLTPDARFDQSGFRARLARYTSQRLTGASA
jgi:hypothetical protein